MCHSEILYTRTEGLQQKNLPSQFNRLGKNNSALLPTAPREEMMALKEREHAPLLTISCPKEPAGELAKGPVGVSYGSQLLLLHPGSPKPQASALPSEETTWSCYLAGHRELQLLPHLQARLWPVLVLYICP